MITTRKPNKCKTTPIFFTTMFVRVYTENDVYIHMKIIHISNPILTTQSPIYI